MRQPVPLAQFISYLLLFPAVTTPIVYFDMKAGDWFFGDLGANNSHLFIGIFLFFLVCWVLFKRLDKWKYHSGDQKAVYKKYGKTIDTNTM